MAIAVPVVTVGPACTPASTPGSPMTPAESVVRGERHAALEGLRRDLGEQQWKLEKMVKHLPAGNGATRTRSGTVARDTENLPLAMAAFQRELESQREHQRVAVDRLFLVQQQQQSSMADFQKGLRCSEDRAAILQDSITSAQQQQAVLAGFHNESRERLCNQIEDLSSSLEKSRRELLLRCERQEAEVSRSAGEHPMWKDLESLRDEQQNALDVQVTLLRKEFEAAYRAEQLADSAIDRLTLLEHSLASARNEWTKHVGVPKLGDVVEMDATDMRQQVDGLAAAIVAQEERICRIERDVRETRAASERGAELVRAVVAERASLEARVTDCKAQCAQTTSNAKGLAKDLADFGVSLTQLRTDLRHELAMECEASSNEITHLRCELVDAVSVLKGQLEEWMQLVGRTREEMGALAQLQDMRCATEAAPASTCDDIVRIERRVGCLANELSALDMVRIERRVGHLETELSALQLHRQASVETVVGGIPQDACRQSSSVAAGSMQGPLHETVEPTTRKQSAEVEKLQARLAALMALDSMQAAASSVRGGISNMNRR